MATLREQLGLVLGWLQQHPQQSYGEQCARELELFIRQIMGGERVYVPPPGSRKDGERAEAIREAAKRLPTGMVCERFGVSRQYVQRLSKTQKSNQSGPIS